MKLRGRERHVDVFEEGLSGDPFYSGRGLDEVIAGLAGLFAAESVGKNERFGKLTSAHQKTGAVDGPLAFKIHNAFLSPHPVSVSGFDRCAAVARRMLVSSGATVLAEKGRVNYIRIVQPWNFGSRVRCDESGSSMGQE